MLKKSATTKGLKKDEETPPASPKTNPTSPNAMDVPITEERKRREEEQKRFEEEKRKREEDRLRKEEEQRKKDEEIRKREEAIKEKNREERRRKKEWQRTDDTEELSALTAIDPECKFTTYSDKVYEAFASLTELTRELNTERAWHTPEFIFIGHQGSGKSSVLETIVGHPITNGGSTKRPVIINMINNLSCDEPKIMIKRDGFIKEFSKEDRVVTLAELPDEIEKRNQATSEPINIRYEYKNCWTQTFIDTPGLVSPGEKQFEEQEKLISELTKSQDKYIVFVEDCKEWEHTDMASIAERFDPKQMRSVFVYTKFNFHLLNMTSAKDVTAYLAGKPATKAKAFFVSSFANQVKLINSTPERFREKLTQSNQRDVNFLVKLQYDVKHDNSIGIQALRKYMIELTHKKYQDSIPDLLKQIRNIKKERNDQLASIQHHIKTLDKNKLRAIASNYVSDFLQYVVTLLQGSEQSLEGIPSNSGYTLDDEKIHFGEWIDGAGNVLQLSAAEKKERISNWNTKLLGGREFERLLIEFKLICEQTAATQLSLDEIATSAGLSGLKNVSNQLWAASDLVQRNLEVMFVPLLKQLLDRSTAIAKLLTSVADNIFESKRSQKFRGRNETAEYQISVKEFPRFIWYVKDLFEQAVEAAAKESLQKCLDELQCTRLIQWENSTKRMEDLKAKKIDQPAKSVQALTSEIFRDQQRRITKNVLLKCYDNFLVKMQKTITGTVQGQVAVLSEEDMNEMFDLVSLINKLRAEEGKLTEILKNDTEAPFMEAAAKFRI